MYKIPAANKCSRDLKYKSKRHHRRGAFSCLFCLDQMFSAGGACKALYEGAFVYGKLVTALRAFHLIQRSFAVIEVFVLTHFIEFFLIICKQIIHLSHYGSQGLVNTIGHLCQDTDLMTQERDRICQFSKQSFLGIVPIQFGRFLKTLQISCLLYTSPSPRD